MSQIHVTLLQEARRLIDSETENFICIAIQEAAIRSREWGVGAQAKRLEDYICKPMIEDLIDDCPTLEGWLTHMGIDQTLLTAENMKAYRLRYIDHLIEEWRDVP